MKKYELTEETVTVYGKTLYRIRAVRDFGSVKTGEFGGYIEKEENLSRFGNAWVSDNAWVFDNARVYDNAWVFGDAWVSGNARVSDNARVFGNAWVYGDYPQYLVGEFKWLNEMAKGESQSSGRSCQGEGGS